MKSMYAMLPAGVMPGPHELEEYILKYRDASFSLVKRVREFELSRISADDYVNVLKSRPMYTYVGADPGEENSVAAGIRRDKVAKMLEEDLKNLERKEAFFRDQKEEDCYERLRRAFGRAMVNKILLDFLEGLCQELSPHEYERTGFPGSDPDTVLDLYPKAGLILRGLLEASMARREKYPSGTVWMPLMAFKLRMVRSAYKMSQECFADKLGYDGESYSLLEQGRVTAKARSGNSVDSWAGVVRAMAMRTFVNPYWLQWEDARSLDYVAPDRWTMSVQEAKEIHTSKGCVLPMFVGRYVVQYWLAHEERESPLSQHGSPVKR